jgi:hypothetical protein
LHAEAGGLGDGEHSVEHFQRLGEEVVLCRLLRTLTAMLALIFFALFWLLSIVGTAILDVVFVHAHSQPVEPVVPLFAIQDIAAEAYRSISSS